MNLNKEINNSQLLTALGACIILGIVLAYFLSPHLRKTMEVEDTLTLEKQQPSRGAINIPPADLKRTPIDKGTSSICAQVITPARNPKTGEQRNFPTPCDVPEGWEPLFPAPDRPQ